MSGDHPIIEETCEDQTFFRIESGSTNWTTGKTIKCGDVENPFTKDWKSASLWAHGFSEGARREAKFALADAYNRMVQARGNPKEKDVAIRSIMDSARKILRQDDNSLIANRELTYELVRREHFPDAISRMYCYYLIPDLKDGVRYWWETLKSQGMSQRHIFEVKVNGEYSQCDASVLSDVAVRSIDSIYREACEYWTGDSSISSTTEILFRGNIKVVRKVSASHFGCE